MKTSAYCTGRIRWGNAKECALQQLLREKGLFTGSGLVSVVFGPVYFGVRRAHKGRCHQMVDQSTMVEDCRREVRLTAREREVLCNPALSWETRYIAEGLGVSWYTARNHIENMRTKLGAPAVWRQSWSP